MRLNERQEKYLRRIIREEYKNLDEDSSMDANEYIEKNNYKIDAKKIAQWVIDNRYPKNEQNKFSDSEMYYELLSLIGHYAATIKEESIETITKLRKELDTLK